MNKARELVRIARDIASETQDFHRVKGPGHGDRASCVFMNELRRRAIKQFGTDYSEKQISGDIKSAVDFFIPEEKTVIEIALTLKNPLSEFHKDIFKALLAIDNGKDIQQLVFVCKPGGRKRHQEPASQAIMRWLKDKYRIEVTIEEID